MREEKKMSMNVLGHGIIGMKEAESFEINDMNVRFVVEGEAFDEKIVSIPETIPTNISKLNLLTESGKKLCLKPSCQKDVNELKVAFNIPVAKELQLREDCRAAR